MLQSFFSVLVSGVTHHLMPAPTRHVPMAVPVWSTPMSSAATSVTVVTRTIPGISVMCPRSVCVCV